jgi:cytochrome c peroxidase
MPKFWFFIAILYINLLLSSCSGTTNTVAGAENVHAYYLQCLRHTDSLVAQLDTAAMQEAGAERLQQLFKEARLAYKRIEFLAAYQQPGMVKLLNGPAVPEVEAEDNQYTIVAPEGFQVIESLIFPVYEQASKATLLRELAALRATLRRLRVLTENDTLTDSLIFRALRKELFRVTALGLTGYDSDIARYAIAESHAAMTGIKNVLAFYHVHYRVLDQGLQYLSRNTDFDTFDRMHFITAYADPVSKLLQETAVSRGIDIGDRPGALRPGAVSLFGKDAFNTDYYTADPEDHISDDKVLLGRHLFYDTRLSGNGQRSCASCHQPERAFTDGIVRSTTIDGTGKLSRNTITLLNAGLQPAFFYDARVTYLEDQITDVLTNKNEMNGSVSKALSFLKEDSVYPALFRKAFPRSKEPVTPYHLQNVIASYVRSLISLDAPFDRYMAGDHTQLTRNEINGFNLYMGKAKCATCHFVPLFNAALPPDFNIAETEVIGVPSPKDTGSIDEDKGHYLVSPAAPNLHAFRVPTLRNIALTAPYMHNGVYQTLEQVLDFYNKGGGSGLGIRLTNQTLPAGELGLTAKEQEDIIAFLKTLTDTVSAGRERFKK